jgi:small subunit ribosomal protein S7
MSRKSAATARPIVADPKFNSDMVSRFINMVMRSGKKSVAERIVYGAIDQIGQKSYAGEAIEMVEKALQNVRPVVEVKSRRVGGATYQVPVEVRPGRRTALAMRWVIEAAKKRSENTMPKRLAGELLDAAENRGSAIKKREETHRMAEANKAFAHYRW